MVAAKELEEAAGRYASEAIRLDSQGAHGMAIIMYQRAISALIKLAQLYPEYKLNKLYLERATTYQERIKALQAAHGLIQDDSQLEDLKKHADTGKSYAWSDILIFICPSIYLRHFIHSM